MKGDIREVSALTPNVNSHGIPFKIGIFKQIHIHTVHTLKNTFSIYLTIQNSTVSRNVDSVKCTSRKEQFSNKDVLLQP